MTTKETLTGWCGNGEQSLHHICHGTYTGKGDLTYVCVCPCHQPKTNGQVHYVERRPKQPPVRYVQRRSR